MNIKSCTACLTVGVISDDDLESEQFTCRYRGETAPLDLSDASTMIKTLIDKIEQLESDR